MRITFRQSYRSSGKNNPATTGKLRFAYNVIGTAEELKQYKQSRGDFYIEDEQGTPIHTSLQYVGRSANLIQIRDGRFIADTSAIDQASSLAEQHPFLAGELAKSIVSQLGIAPAPVAVRTTETADLNK